MYLYYAAYLAGCIGNLREPRGIRFRHLKLIWPLKNLNDMKAFTCKGIAGSELMRNGQMFENSFIHEH